MTYDAFLFSKMAAAVIMDFQNMEILGAAMVKTAKICYCAKLRDDWSNHC